MRTQKEIFIANTLKAEGISKPTVNFYVELLQYFEVSDPLVSTSKKLSAMYDCSDRSIQRYIKELSEQFNYIHVKHRYNNDNPDKPYIESNTYSKTYLAIELENKAAGYNRKEKRDPFSAGL